MKEFIRLKINKILSRPKKEFKGFNTNYNKIISGGHFTKTYFPNTIRITGRCTFDKCIFTGGCINDFNTYISYIEITNCLFTNHNEETLNQAEKDHLLKIGNEV